MMKKKSLRVNAFLNGLRSILNLIFPLITFPYVSRVLSVNGIGIYNFANTYVNYFILLAGLGISTYAVREGAKYRDDYQKISKFSSEVFSINVISTLVAYFLLLLSLVVFKNLHNYISSILILSLQILFTTFGTEWIYTIYEEYSYITVRSIVFKIISIFLLFIFVRNENDYLIYAGVTVFAGVGSNILNFFHARNLVHITLVKNMNLRNHLKPIIVIFASTVAVTIYVSTDTTILGLLKSDYAVGIYSVSVKIYNIVSGLITSLVTVTIPRMAMLFGKRMLEQYNKAFSQVFNSILVLMLPAAIGVIMLSKEIVLIIAGEKYLNSVFSLQIISLAIIFSNFSTIFTQCALIPAKREKLALRNNLIIGIINIILNFILIPSLSYDGTSLTTVIAELMSMTMNCWSAWDIVGKIVKSKEVMKNIISSLLGCLGIVIECLLCKWAIRSMILETIISVIFSVMIYAAILILLRNQMALDFIKKIKFKVSKK